ncbi:MAG: LPXTG cell wall anchor domain-containing protein [Micromonosporaceae bacterium]|nr:LPXTG cell wall anchor domain-containing protein [Micromonosporaceae bacterium]
MLPTTGSDDIPTFAGLGLASVIVGGAVVLIVMRRRRDATE